MKPLFFFLTLSITLHAQDTIRVTHNGKQVYELVQLPDTVTVIDTVYVDRPQPPHTGRIQAESYADMQGVQTEGDVVGFINPGDWIRYNNVVTGKSLTFRYSNAAAAVGRKMQVRRDSPTGAVIGEWTHESTGGWDVWKEATIPITAQFTGDIFLTFTGSEGWVCNLDWLEFGDSSPPEPEPDPQFQLRVEKSGTPSSDCRTTPCTTLTRAFQVAASSSQKVNIKVGEGVFVEPQMQVPTTVGLVKGAGREKTIVMGHPSLYAFDRRSYFEKFLLHLEGGGNVTTTFESMSFDGNKKSGGNNASVKGCFAIRDRHGVSLKDVEIRYFNTTAVRMYRVDKFLMQDSRIENSSGRASSFTYYQIEWGNVGGTHTPGQYNIVLRNVDIDAPLFDDGAGMGIINGGPGSYMVNIEMDRVRFNVNPGSSDSEGHHFNIEWIYTNAGNVYIHDSFFNSNISFAMEGDALGEFVFANNVMHLPEVANRAPSVPVEMQISNFTAYGNHLINVRNGAFVSSNTMETWASNNYGNTYRRPFKNWNIHDNIIETRATGNSFPTGFVGGARWPVSNIRYVDNRHVSRASHGAAWYCLVTDDTDVATGIDISGNTFEGQFPPGSQLFDAIGPISGGKAHGNKSTGNFDVTKPRAGVIIIP